MKKKILEKKQCLFLHQGITIGHWFQPLNEHPLKENKLKIWLLSHFSEIFFKETKKSAQPAPEYQHILSVDTQDFLTGIWIWQLTFVSEALLGNPPTQISQYVKLQWGYCTTAYTCGYSVCVLGMDNINIWDCYQNPRTQNFCQKLTFHFYRLLTDSKVVSYH